MGTRNITRIRKDGELKACQYGQWDGYPTSAGRHILEFIAGSDMAAFAEKVAGCTLTNTSGDPEAERFFTGTPADAAVKEVFDAYDELMYGGKLEIEDYRLKAEAVQRRLLRRFGAGLYASYLVATRDTGYRILDVIDEFGPQALYCDDYLLMEECDWQIEAINEVDLDARAVRMEYHGCRREFSFGDIRSMDVAGEMESFEAEADRLDAFDAA